jgi:hypothetical protein
MRRAPRATVVDLFEILPKSFRPLKSTSRQSKIRNLRRSEPGKVISGRTPAVRGDVFLEAACCVPCSHRGEEITLGSALALPLPFSLLKGQTDP